MKIINVGSNMYSLAEKLFPICRSLTGEGNRETLRIIKELLPELEIYEVPTGTKVYDWMIPKEWSVDEAWIDYENGTRIVDFKETNLRLMGYSIPIDQELNLEELDKHLFSMPEHPEWIPYVVSYYKERWGFCLTDNEKKALKPGKYHVHINSKLFDGSLTYGEVYFPGEVEDEICFSTYICHPSMANNELSGPVLQQALANYVKSMKNHYYSYRFLFVPETIGPITYMSQDNHLEHMKKYIKAGFNLSCVGDEREWSYLASPEGNNLADRVIQNILSFSHPDYKRYSFLSRGSDERQYCSPGANLPFAVLSRSKYNTYPEYHTSADNLSFISAKGLQESYDAFVEIIDALEHNFKYLVTTIGEPQLGKRGLWPTLSNMHSGRNFEQDFLSIFNFVAYANGNRDLIEISNIINRPIKTLLPIVDELIRKGVIIIT